MCVSAGQSLIRDLKRTTTHVVEKLSDRIFEATARGQMPDVNDLLKEEEIGTWPRRRHLNTTATTSSPPV